MTEARYAKKAAVIYSEIAERAVIGCMLSEPTKLVEQVRSFLSSEDFLDPSFKLIFATLCQMADAQEAIDGATVHARLGPKAVEIGSPGVLTEALAGFSTVENVGSYMRTVADKAALRKLDAAGKQIQQDVQDESYSVGHIADRAEKLILTAIPDESRAKKSKLTFVHVSQVMNMAFDDSDRYLGDRMLAAGLNSVMAGPGGVGKSRLAMQMAFCCITGRNFLGMPTFAKGKRWLVIQTENDYRRMQDDLAGLMRGFNPSSEEIGLIEENLILHGIEHDHDTLVCVENTDDYLRMDESIQFYRANFVVFDPLNTFTALDLNSDQHMRQVSSTISRLVKRGDPKRVPFLLHHALTGKSGASKAIGWDKSSFGRNSKVLQAWARSQFNLSPRDAEDESLLLLSCGKCSNGKPFPTMGLKLMSNGLYEIDTSFDIDAFREEVSPSADEKPNCSKAKLIDLVSREHRAKPDLVKFIIAQTGLSKQSAYRHIEKAEKDHLIKEDRLTRKYFVTHSLNGH